VLTGAYAEWTGSWASSRLEGGQRLREPQPLFKKLDPSVADEELRRMEEHAGK
jgi:methionyl-tRNA synthetase